jgi:hypothetical protein
MATVTPTYSWPVPTSTDYVKDGASAIEALGDAIDATLGGFFNIKQIVSASYSSSVASSTSTFVDTGLTATITPSSVTNKILVLISSGTIYKTAANTQSQMAMRLLRDATQIWLGYALYTNSSLQIFMPGFSPLNLDSPNTISAVTYKTQIQNVANTAEVGHQQQSRIILIEVEA